MGTVTIRDLSYSHRGGRQVFSDLSTDIPIGRTLLLGPNGAGKTTLIELIAGALTPQKGEIRVSQSRQRRLKKTGTVAWLPQQFEPVRGLTVAQHVAYTGWLAGMPKRLAQEHASAALESVGLSTLRNRKATTLSGGETRRLGLAGVLIQNAPVMLLDEPTVGLDPLQREHFMDAVLQLPQDTSVVMSTHQTDGVEKVFERVMVVLDGHIIFNDATAHFLSLGRAACTKSGETEATREECFRKAFRVLIESKNS